MKKNFIFLLLFISLLFPVGEAGAIFLLIAPGASAAAIRQPSAESTWHPGHPLRSRATYHPPHLRPQEAHCARAQTHYDRRNHRSPRRV